MKSKNIRLKKIILIIFYMLIGCAQCGYASQHKLSEELLNTLDNYTELDLSDNAIDKENAIKLAQIVANNMSLTSINLSSNNIGDGGAMAFATALQQNKKLTSLNLNSNNIGPKGTNALAENLHNYKALTYLNVCYNDIGSEANQKITEALHSNPELKVDFDPYIFLNSNLDFLASKIKYSYSGHSNNIDRDGLKYEYPTEKDNDEQSIKVMEAYKKIHPRTVSFKEQFEIMIGVEVGDCCEQSQLMALILKQEKRFNDKYKIYICDASYKGKQHSFLILVDRENNKIIKSTAEEEENGFKYNWNTLVDKPLIILDPWRKQLYFKITKNKHPLDYLGNMSFEKIKLELRSPDQPCIKIDNEEFKVFCKKMLSKLPKLTE